MDDAKDKFLTVEKLLGQNSKMENDDIERQLALADYLRQPSAQHTTGLGAALGGIGDVINSINGNRRDKAAELQRHQMMAERSARIKAITEALRSPPVEQQPLNSETLFQAPQFDPATNGPDSGQGHF